MAGTSTTADMEEKQALNTETRVPSVQNYRDDLFDDQQQDNHYKFNREFIIGAKRPKNLQLNGNGKINTKITCSRPPSNIKITYNYCIAAVALSDWKIGARESIKGHEHSTVTEIDNNNNPIYFKSIKAQSWSESSGGNSRHLYWQYINYMEMIDQSDKVYIIGKMREDTKQRSYIQHETGKLFLTAIFVSTFSVIGLQFVDIVHDINKFDIWNKYYYYCCKPEINIDSLLAVYHLPNNQGFHTVNNSSSKILDKHMIGVEDAFILQVLDLTIENICVHTHDPFGHRGSDYISIIEKCYDGDLGTMHSVMALQRFIDNIIQTDCAKHVYSHVNVKNIIKTRQYWRALYDVVYMTKRIYYYTPTLDLYSFAYLNNSKWNIFESIVVFIAQLTMLILLISSLKFEDIEESFQALSVIISICISFIVFVLVKKQVIGVFQFFAVFPDSYKTMPMILSICSNVIIAILIVPLNFLILVVHSIDDEEGRFNLVLNSLAILFILEIDDQIIDIAHNDEKALYLSKLYQIFRSKIKEIDPKYKVQFFDPKTLSKVGAINRKECRIDFD